MKVYAAINAVQRALSHTGIVKNRRNTQGSGYNFRGIDDVYNAIAPLLAEHGLCIVPRFTARTCEERQSKAGGALFYVTVEAEFDFISSEDGSKHTARTFGEAMDSGDKATNKAMSAAYKYAAFQTFAIPTEGNPDADAETHETKISGAVETKEGNSKARTGVMADVLSTLPPMADDQAQYIAELALNVIDLHKAKGPAVAFDRVEAEQLDNDQRIYLWNKLPSNVRSALKTERGLRIGAA